MAAEITTVAAEPVREGEGERGGEQKEIKST